MSTDPRPANIRQAVGLLSRSQRGRNAMRHLLACLDDGAGMMGGAEQDAVTTILAGAWGGYPTAAREAMRDALAVPPIF